MERFHIVGSKGQNQLVAGSVIKSNMNSANESQLFCGRLELCSPPVQLNLIITNLTLVDFIKFFSDPFISIIENNQIIT